MNNSIGDIVNRGNMIHSKVWEGSRRIARSCKLYLHTILIFSLYTHCVQTMYNVCSTYKYFKYSSTYKYLAKYLSISTSTLGNLRKYLSKVQVLSNLYLSVLKYKYSCTWPHVCLDPYFILKLIFNILVCLVFIPYSYTSVTVLLG